MERAIGSTFYFHGSKDFPELGMLLVREDRGCKQCVFYTDARKCSNIRSIRGDCGASIRNDETAVAFVKLLNYPELSIKSTSETTPIFIPVPII